ncbi:mechanosensitive ion channel family protein [Mucilaginibacter sp. RS28]|uniref:Mechanosensitive ion channel family protein n=1 Tax=Mucilaginibacter straminoryzae TaxID=2932774 RepID=A0A9X1X428_9SPHI|nr:mechanosensitive ion channel family protein [Mucilaginibacter straminoryzae]MCJ8209293.1 mechanosensitive ion channel family protein [Mucilaginibacter straminoryzae]
MDIHLLYNAAYLWLATRGPKLLIGIIVLIIGLWFIRFLRGYMRRRMAHRQVHSSLQPFFLSLTFTALHLVLIIVVMEVIGLELTIFTAIISAATVAAGLALSGTLQNFAGGVMILLLKPFEINDNIIAQGQDGIVSEIQIFYTVIITFDNKTVIIPNGKLFNEVIVNVSREGKRRLDIEMKISYAYDSEQVKATMTKTVKATKNILVEPAMYIGVETLDPDGMRYTVRVWVEPSNFLRAKLDLQERLIQDLKSSGVKLPGMA